MELFHYLCHSQPFKVIFVISYYAVRNNKYASLPFQDFPSAAVSAAYVDPSVDNSTDKFSWAVPNFVEIRDFAETNLGWPRKKIDELMRPVMKRFGGERKSTQKRIDSFFAAETTTAISMDSRGRYQSSQRVKTAIDKVLGRVPRAEEVRIIGARVSSHNHVDVDWLAVLQARSKPVEKAPEDSVVRDEQLGKDEAKRKAVEIYKRSLGGGSKCKKRKGVATKKATKATNKTRRVVTAQHNLSESESDD